MSLTSSCQQSFDLNYQRLTSAYSYPCFLGLLKVQITFLQGGSKEQTLTCSRVLWVRKGTTHILVSRQWGAEESGGREQRTSVLHDPVSNTSLQLPPPEKNFLSQIIRAFLQQLKDLVSSSLSLLLLIQLSLCLPNGTFLNTADVNRSPNISGSICYFKTMYKFWAYLSVSVLSLCPSAEQCGGKQTDPEEHSSSCSSGPVHC